jgi:energy-coupling factor transporter ATP-binding protein EcfA2
MIDQRPSYLTDWARRLEAAAVRGVFGKPIGIKRATPISGPRAAVLLLYCGIDSGALLRGLQADDCATLRQLIPFEFSGEPQCFMAERAVRVEVGWPSGLSDDNIPLHTLGQHPMNGGRWLIGRNERGDVPTGILDDMIPHWLISGQTGSGKSTALVSTVGQLSQDSENRLVLIDAKHGASFRPLVEVRGLVGPLAADVTAARAALGWCVREMARRYTDGRDDRRLIIVIDELQAIVTDDGAAESLRRLVEQGRGARIHVIAATQHPVVQALGGPTVGRNLVGRLALRVSDADASRVAIGASWPRADHLLGRGDCYLVKPSVVHRCQVAWWDGRIVKGAPDLAEWPEETDDLPDLAGWPSGDEVGAAVVSASRDEGRVKFQRMLKAAGLTASNDKAVRLLSFARDVLAAIEGRGYAVRPSDESDIPEIEPYSAS